MVRTIIPAFPEKKKQARKDLSSVLHISECFSDTVQGENFSGYPSVFLRLQHCILSCAWCDTLEVWKKGNPYSVFELVDLLKDADVIGRLQIGHHLVVTGGSPLKQQEALVHFFPPLAHAVGSVPFIEIENEAVLMPSSILEEAVSQWNNSPKLSNSGMKKSIRYKPEVIEHMSRLHNSTFKFVITGEQDWDEIQNDFLEPGLIRRNQIVLMPEGSTRVELQEKYEKLIELCCREGVRMCDRLQVTIFDKVVGV